VCDECGGTDITEDATASWDFTEQKWVVVDLSDYSWCSDCDHEVRAELLLVNDLKHKAIMTINKEEKDGISK
jgi:hypothetical protein